jgi:hypothetical protein
MPHPKKNGRSSLITWMMVHGAKTWLSSEQGCLMHETAVWRMAPNKTSQNMHLDGKAE